MQDIIFREYDIRGVIGTELLIDEVYDLVKAMVVYLKSKNPMLTTLAVGRDGRLHSPAFYEQTCRAICESGCNVVDVGLCPSPALYFAVHTLPVDGGLMITASHNPKEYNGFKICSGTDVVWGQELKKIRDLYKQGAAILSDTHGVVQVQPVIPLYVQWLVEHFEHLIGNDLRVVVDCGNGAGGAVLPALIEAMHWPQVELLYATVDGTYPHHEADPVKPENMLVVKKRMERGDFAFGVGLDGDADRMAAMTPHGELVSGDRLLTLFARQVLAEHSGATILADIKASAGFLELVTQWQGVPVLAPSGHAPIKQQMRMSGALLAGELSCHFFFKDRYFGYDDGIYAFMRLFELIVVRQESLAKLMHLFPQCSSSPEYRIACDEDKKEAVVAAVRNYFQEQGVPVMTIDGVRATLPYGWGLVRASNTQAVLSLRFESEHEQELQHVKKEFITALQPFFETAWLMKSLDYEEPT